MRRVVPQTLLAETEATHPFLDLLRLEAAAEAAAVKMGLPEGLAAVLAGVRPAWAELEHPAKGSLAELVTGLALPVAVVVRLRLVKMPLLLPKLATAETVSSLHICWAEAEAAFMSLVHTRVRQAGQVL